MTYQEALHYIHSVGWRGSRPGLSRTLELARRMGDPQNRLKFVHVAGTNGKGSFSAMLAAILTRAGYRTGLYTSPFISRFNERIRVDGEDIPDSVLAEVIERIMPEGEAMEDKPTEFELITVAAFLYFERCGCDIVVLEAGMGGELDSTNIISPPILSVITPVSLDHTAILGDTVEKIAATKAKIIKEDRPALCGRQCDEVMRVIEERCRESGSTLYKTDFSALSVKSRTLEGSRFDFGDFRDIFIPALGLYQPENAAGVLTAVNILRENSFDISDETVKAALAGFVWRGRFEPLCRDPYFIFDGSHNPQGLAAAIESIKYYFPKKHIYLLMGVMADKNYRLMLSMLAGNVYKMYSVMPENPRALGDDALSREAAACGLDCTPCGAPKDGARTVYSAAASDPDGVAVALGSLYMYGEVERTAILNIQPNLPR